jgi:hypothetical protein
MLDQPDMWPLHAPVLDELAELRARWCYALMLLGATLVDGLVLRAVEKWIRTPGAPDWELIEIFYGDAPRILTAEAQGFLRERGLVASDV